MEYAPKNSKYANKNQTLTTCAAGPPRDSISLIPAVGESCTLICAGKYPPQAYGSISIVLLQVTQIPSQIIFLRHNKIICQFRILNHKTFRTTSDLFKKKVYFCTFNRQLIIKKELLSKHYYQFSTHKNPRFYDRNEERTHGQ